MKKIILGGCILFSILSCKENKLENRNNEASIPESFGFDTMKLKTINTVINPKAGTTSTLYGNEEAFSALKGAGSAIDGYKKLVLITWKQQDDPKWFGAKIPGGLAFIEVLRSKDFSDTAHVEYERLSGNPLKASSSISEGDRQKSIRMMLSLKPAVTP